jgi:hypothetical protein
MNKTAIFMALVFGLSFSAVHAAEVDDLTMQVIDSNDPADVVNEIELPDVEKNALEDSQVSSDSHDALEQDAEDSKSEMSSEMETDVEDARQQVEDSVDSTRDDVESVQDDTVNEMQDTESDSSTN